MLGRFFYGQCSLSEAFWKYSFLGILCLGFISRILMIMLQQTMGYQQNFYALVINCLSFIQANTAGLAFLAFYIASFISLVVYSIICIGGMWNTYKEYNKSKTLAMICVILVVILAFFAIEFSMYHINLARY